MTATFDPALTTAKDRVRQRIGQTDLATTRVQDETIAHYLESKTELGTARQLCLDIAAAYAPIGDVTLDDQQQKGGKIYERYIAMAAEIFEEMGIPLTDGAAAGAVLVMGVGDNRGPLEGTYPGKPCDWRW